VVFAVNGSVREGLFLGGMWMIHVLFFNPTSCRVEKIGDGDPCTRPARGLLRTCGTAAHRGAKWQALPGFVRVGRWGLPRPMWPNPSIGTGRRPAVARSEPPPRRRPRADRRAESVGTVIAVASLLVAVLSFIRDLIAG
jgi:hypothetical protein